MLAFGGVCRDVKTGIFGIKMVRLFYGGVRMRSAKPCNTRLSAQRFAALALR